MNKKALLLIIPFAAAGLAGCERANPNPPGPTPDPQCESATVNIKSAGDVTSIKPGQTLQLTAELNISGCSFSWNSSDSTIATVDTNGLVTGVKAGDVVIHYGSGSFNLKVDNDAPTPPPVVEGNVYLFNNTFGEVKNFSSIDEEGFLGTLVTQGEDIIKGYQDATNAYIGGNGGNEADGSNWTLLNCLKVGKSKNKGSITLKLDSSIAFSSIKVKAIGSRDDGELTINGVTKAVAKKAVKDDLEPIEVEFEISSGASELAISNKDDATGNFAIMITSIEFVKGDTPTPTKEVKSIEITGTATKTEYFVGDAYSAAGLSVIATYTDDTSATVSATIRPNKAKAELGDTSVTFSATFGGKTATIDVDVTVNEKPAPTGEITVDKEYSLTMTSLGLGKAYSSSDEGEIGWVDLYGQTDPVDSIQGNKRAASDTKTALNSEIYNILAFSKEIKSVEFACAKDPRDNKMSIFFGTSNQPSDNEIKLGKGSDHTFAANETTIVEAPKGYKYFDIKWMEFSSVFSSIKFTFESEPEKQLTSLSIKTQPSKVDYNEGESFNAAGLVLHAVYSDSSEEDITSGWTIAPSGALAPTDNKVVVSYGGKSVNVDITVTARELQSIVIDTRPSKVNYVEGESFDPAGMVVKANYNVGDPAVITNYTYSPNGALQLSDNEIVVSYNGKTASVAITVSEAPQVLEYTLTVDSKSSVVDENNSGASVEFNPEPLYEADRGAQWAKKAATITITDLPEGTLKGIVLDVSANKDTKPKINVTVGGAPFGGEYTLASGKHQLAEFTGSANAGTVVISIGATTDGSAYVKAIKLVYEAGEPPVVDPAVNSVTVSSKTASLDLTETTSVTLSATVDAVGGASEDVVWSIESGDDYVSLPEIKTGSSIVVSAAAEGTAVVKVASAFDPTKYDTCEVTVSEIPAPQPELDYISVDASNAKTEYTEGETVVKDGLVVTAHYTNGGEDKVLQAAEYSVSPSGALTIENDTVTVTYEGKTDTYAITVSEQTAEKGTLENPFTPEEAKIEALKLEETSSTSSPKPSEKAYYIKGTVSKLAKAFDSFMNYSFWLDDAFEGWQLFNGPNKDKFNDGDIMPGDEVIIYGKLLNFKGTPENATDAYVYSVKKGTVQVSIDEASSKNAQVTLTGGTTALNGSTYSFDVVANDGYELVSVKVNGVDAVKGQGNSYSISVNGPVKIIVATKEAGQKDPIAYDNVSLAASGASKGCQNYTTTDVKYTGSKVNIVADNFNNNNKDATWDYIRAGIKNATSTATLKTESSISAEIISVEIDIGQLIRGSCTGTLYVANNSSFTGADEYTFSVSDAGVITINITNAMENAYYKIDFVCVNATTSNGVVNVKSVAFNYIPE